MNRNLLNTQIKALNLEHGAKIVELYESNGYDVRNFKGNMSNSLYINLQKQLSISSNLIYTTLLTI
jgi:hypothetical protein